MSATLLTTITADKLQNGEFKTELPEYYALSAYVENGLWHDHQDVFSHCVKVMRSFEKIMEFDFLTEPARAHAKAYFDQVEGSLSRREQLKAVVLLHDIAKPLVFKQHADGKAGCSTLHEALGAAAVADFQVRLGLTDAVVGRVKHMVLLHGVVSEMMNVSLEKNDHTLYLAQFAKVAGDCINELLCFIYADMSGGDLDRTMPAAFEERRKLLTSWLEARFSAHV